MARKILLADDSVTAQNMGRKILAEAGYDVTTVNNGSAALKKIAEQKPELILLDVYMPGYSGLEVCQRLKEAEDTAQIPVLLTVGKLEPFKAEEARRVHADAFIIKPFEATELLTTLTKLEEKIIPEPAPKRGARAAKASGAESASSAKESAKEKEKSREAEGGWKSRLRAAVNGEKAEGREAKAEPAPASSSGFRNLRIEAPLPTHLAHDDVGSGGLPPDATIDELATIAAVASALDQTQPDTTETSEFGAVEPRSGENEGTFASLATVDSHLETGEAAGIPEIGELHPDSPQIVEFQAPPKMAGPWDEPTSDTPLEESTGQLSEPEPGRFAAELEPPPASSALSADVQEQEDFEVANALASLVPVNGNGSGTVAFASGAPLEDSGVSAHSEQHAPVFFGPRWMAQEVSLAEGEGALLLEQEMQNFYASVRMADSHAVLRDAEAEATRLADESFATPDELAPIMEPATTVFEQLDSAVQDMMPEAIPAEFSAEPEAIVEAVATTGDSVSAHDPVAITEPETVGQQTAPAIEESAAFAAAASVGYGVSDPADVPSRETIGDTTPSPEHDPELAAAWASWRQIRDSVVAPEVTSQLADVAAAEFRDIKREEARSEEARAEAAQPESQSPTAADSAAIANIVESVLAQLKPKLIEEIAKKLAQSKTE